MLGNSRAEARRLHEASYVLKHAVRLDPEDAQGYRLLAASLDGLNRAQESRAALKNAVQLDPTTQMPAEHEDSVIVKKAKKKKRTAKKNGNQE